MGRRSVSTTKSGKFMNPTDQARKEARKKELKKNKRQRLLVRTAVLKNKDPGMIIQELDKLDEIEYNPVDAPSLAEKVIKDKRKKLKETFDRVMKLYQKEDPTLWNELKSIEADYERRRFHRIQYFEAVKQAESISVEDIPLPSNNPPSVSDIPLPSDEPIPEPTSILKKSMINVDADAPGVPVGSPPDLSSGDEDDDMVESSDEVADAKKKPEEEGVKKSVHFLTHDVLDKFMQEVEEEFKTFEEELQPPGMEKSGVPLPTGAAPAPPAESSMPPAPVPVIPPQAPQPPPMLPPMQPPPNRMQFYGQQPPPPGGFPPRMRVPYRMPPQMQNRSPGFGFHANRPRFRNQVYTSAPIVSQQQQQREVISAKPQIRSLSADVTRFVPVAVKTHKASAPDTGHRMQQSHPVYPKPQPPPAQPIGPSKDDAYAEFMKEMQGLL